MAFSARTLRIALAALGLLLAAALAGLIAVGRMRIGKSLKSIPRRLGVDIEQESDNFTYSQSLAGRTVYTIHAAKELQHRNGQITLRNVGIIMYGKQGDRADRIHGDDFEYDQPNGVLHAVGPVYIDLAPPQRQPAAGGAKSAPAGAEDAHLIHIKTSGLTFAQKTEVAATDEAVEFRVGELTGNSIGASYDSGKGVVLLKSQVHLSGLRDGRPVNLTARRAELDRVGNIANLEVARYVSATDSGSESASADHAVVHMDQDGAPRVVDADGHVALSGSGHGTVTGDTLHLDLDVNGQPRDGHLYRNVAFLNDDPAHPGKGQAADARVAFDSSGHPHQVVLTGAVSLDERAGASERRLQAAEVHFTLSGGGKQALVVRAGQAFGGSGQNERAWLRLTGEDTQAKGGEGTLTTDIRGDTLTGRFAGGSKATELDGLDGGGHTEIERVARDAGGSAGTDDTSTGDTLKIDLAKDARAHLALSRAEQRGSVRLTRIAARTASSKAGAGAVGPEIEHARADLEVYDANAEVATLTGAVAITDAESALFAARAELNRRTGISTATGAVRVSYVNPEDPAGEPVHVIAARAVSSRSTGVTEFTADRGARTRMWQGDSAVEAPVLDFNRTGNTLFAHGSGTEVAPVRTVLVSAPASPKPGAASPKPVTTKSPNTGPVHVLSDTLNYSEAQREAVFGGHVRVDDDEGTMFAEQATAFLALPANAQAQTPAAAAPGLFGGRLDRVVGIGNVRIEQPGRLGTGDRVVYTAADQMFTLTGTRSAAPKVVDEQRGEVTGGVLRFRSGDNTVFVEGDAEHKRVQSETKIKQ